LPSLDLPKIRKNKFIEIIPINTGCLGNCTYCKTKHARGHLGSYKPEVIVERMLQATEEGVKEIWLTSEDTCAYGRDIDTDIVQLLVLLTKHLPIDVMLRVGMTNPPYIKEHLKELG
jgi:threonylcarbamoyladenosine tRNA methylthiotransferase CDKAL1